MEINKEMSIEENLEWCKQYIKILLEEKDKMKSGIGSLQTCIHNQTLRFEEIDRRMGWGLDNGN